MAIAKQPEAPAADKKLSAAKNQLNGALQGLPYRSAGGAVAGGLIAEVTAIGGFYYGVLKVLENAAVKSGSSLAAMLHDGSMGNIAHYLQKHHPNFKENSNLLAASVLASPFIGAAIGAWATGTMDVHTIKTRQQAVDTLRQGDEWAGKIVQEPNTEHGAKR